ncbi:MAG: NAD(P)H-hydrate dehydratase [Oscillospiraceae bacterium]
MIYVTPSQMKAIEKASDESGVSLLNLMQNAGTSLTESILAINIDLSKGIVFLCGGGNNAGDGFVSAKQLAEIGLPITVALLCGEPSTLLSTEVFCDLSESSAEVLYLNDNIDKIFAKISSASLVVDAVFGTGFHGDLPPQVKACFSYVTRSKTPIAAVDVPSGGDCLTGEFAENSLSCDYTITFSNPKIGIELYPLKNICGEVIIADIGIPSAAFHNVDHTISDINFSQMKTIIPERSPTSHKGDFGRLVNISGSAKMVGAAGMSTLAALRSGVGLCTVASAKSVTTALSSSIFEAIYLPLEENSDGEISFSNAKKILSACEKATAVTIGCGLGVSDDTKNLVEFLLNNLSCTVILDADGINALASRIDIIKNAKASIIITPHVKELARLMSVSTEEAIKNRFDYAISLAEAGVTVVAKGVPTIIAGGNGFCYINTNGNSGLSRGGSGDVLTGIIGSFAAQGISPTDAAVAGTFLHGLAADRVAEKLSMQGMLPTDIIAELPLLFKEMNR